MNANLSMRQNVAVRLGVAGVRAARSSSRAIIVPRASATLAQSSELQAIGKALQDARALPPSMRQDALRSAGRIVKEKLNALREAETAMLWKSYDGRAKRKQVRSMKITP